MTSVRHRVSRLSASAAGDRIAVQMRKHLAGQLFEASESKVSGSLHFLRRGVRRAAEHGLGIVHDLCRELRRFACMGGHVRQERHQDGLKRHDASAQLVVCPLTRDFFSFSPVFVAPKPPREVMEVADGRLADMRRKTFRALRLLEGPKIRAAIDRLAQCEAERYLGFGHPPEDVDHYKVKGEDLAAHIDFEILKGFACFRHLTFSDLKGVSPEEWFVMHLKEQAT